MLKTPHKRSEGLCWKIHQKNGMILSENLQNHEGIMLEKPAKQWKNFLEKRIRQWKEYAGKYAKQWKDYVGNPHKG
jgi:hypothetical protein